ncbi:hypothetical protein CROQUDRAFT_130124 [Cronartium quercuum f. sp. fusiforme G11]|uniref:Uncharacterized protein n=1 Tax=Cronartium quercuum f. sp. fusiforme G11 TaxID=708437 RepID=A0A9P6NXA6_9BASI|nr:hypothetical protein CROQUDRAFT_130124 [Cronartium quercuum f. sp. fusiforme G11]
MLRALQPTQLAKPILSRTDCLQRLHSLRWGSSYSHPSIDSDGTPFESPEGFSNSLFLWGAASLVGLAAYQTFSPASSPASANKPVSQTSGGTDLIVEAEDEQKPWLTRYLAYHFASDPEDLKKINEHNMAVVFESADKAFFKAGIEKPAIRRLRNGGGFDIASPYGLIPGAQTDLSDLKIKSYQQDCRAPELPTEEKSDEESS